MEKYEFTHIVNFLFKTRDKYENLSDEDRERLFFIVNRSFAREFPIHAEFFNKKKIDKSNAMDIWLGFCHKKRFNNIPKWWSWGKPKFKTKTTKSISTIIKKDEIKYLAEFYDISEEDVLYLVENHTAEIKEEVKKLRKFNKK